MPMIRSAHQGEYGSQTKLSSADIPATIMPATRAQVWPLIRKMPIASKARPTRRCSQPQTVRSKGVDVVRQDDEVLVANNPREAFDGLEGASDDHDHASKNGDAMGPRTGSRGICRWCLHVCHWCRASNSGWV